MTQPATSDSTRSTDSPGNLVLTQRVLKVVYGLVPIVAGIDKFTNVLVEWTTYLPLRLVDVLPMEPSVFMYVVGVIEVVAGGIVLTRYTKEGASLVAVWLVSIAVVQLLAGNYDIAVRDLVMAFGAFALVELTKATTVR